MELVNQTALAAEAVVSDHGLSPSGRPRRSLTLVAKATFRVDKQEVQLETDAPYPVLRDEEPTRAGFFPRDVVPPRSDGLEVCLLGSAYAPRGAPTPEMTVALSLGGTERYLRVIGDRTWRRGANGELLVEPPRPFTQMELSWARAFGGTAEVYVDESTSMPIHYPLNSEGRGFDPGESVRGLAEQTGCAAGFPRVALDQTLPNVEPFGAADYDPADQVVPECWAPMPLQLGLRMKLAAEARGVRLNAAPDRPFPRDEVPAREGLWFAHPALRFGSEILGTRLRLTGCSPGGSLDFAIPNLVPMFDYELGPRTGHGVLRAQVMTILPDESLFTITYRHWTGFVLEDESWDRSVRLQLQ